MPRTRTNIEIDDSPLEAVMRRYGVRTKTEAVDLALRHLAGQPMTRAEAVAMRGAHAIGPLPGDELPGDELPGDELPGDELPGDELPTDATAAS